MIFTHPTDSDWLCFTSLAAKEGWSVPQYEKELLTSELRDAAYVLKDEEQFLGFVSAVAYEKSGWIGNLIVPHSQRGNGYGRMLFEKAIHVLDEKKLQSIWLTASTEGKPLYEQYGFVDIGVVERYALPPCPEASSARIASRPADLQEKDLQVWSESRSSLITRLLKDGLQLQYGQSTALLQKHEGIQVVGPWYQSGTSDKDFMKTLERCIAERHQNIPLIVDLVNNNRAAGEKMRRKGFEKKGENRLMVKGCQDHVDLDSLVSLASLGSMG